MTRFTVFASVFQPGCWRVYDGVAHQVIFRGTESECCAYAASFAPLTWDKQPRTSP